LETWRRREVEEPRESPATSNARSFDKNLASCFFVSSVVHGIFFHHAGHEGHGDQMRDDDFINAS
jgi:hypothetical protein